MHGRASLMEFTCLVNSVSVCEEKKKREDEREKKREKMKEKIKSK